MNLRDQALSGVKWTTVSMVLVTVFQFAQVAVLARILDPHDFGLMAIMMIVIGFSQVFMDMGISKAIIQRQNLSHIQLSSLYWLNIFSGLVMTLLVAGLSPVIAHFYGEPAIQPLIIQLSSIFLIISIGNQYRVLCQKELQFNRMAVIEIAAAVISFGVSVTLAWKGFGVRSLVYAMLSQAALSSLLFLIYGLKRHHKPSLVYRHGELKGLFSFGFYQMGENSINFLGANIDKLLIGKMIGMQAVGFYNLAWQLIIFPVLKINPVVNKVAFPVYSRLQSQKEQLSQYYFYSVSALSLVTMPILVFLFFFSSEIVRMLYGQGWEQTAILIKILSVVGIMRAMGNPGGALILALGHANVGFWWNIFWTAITAASMYAVLKYYPTGEAASSLLAGLSVTVGLAWHVIIARTSGISYLPVVKHFLKILLLCMAIGAGAFYAMTYMTFLPSDDAFFRLAAGGLVFGILYGCYLLVFERAFLTFLLRRKPELPPVL